MKTILLLIILFSTETKAEIVSIIKKGTVLTCPKDNKPVMKVEKDLSLFEEISLSNFSFLVEFPKDIEKTVPCEVIKELCFHINNKWIGFSKDCSIIPNNSGKHTFKEFIDDIQNQKKERSVIINQELICEKYDTNFEICTTKDKKWQCLKSEFYPKPTNIGPCTKN